MEKVLLGFYESGGEASNALDATFSGGFGRASTPSLSLQMHCLLIILILLPLGPGDMQAQRLFLLRFY